MSMSLQIWMDELEPSIRFKDCNTSLCMSYFRPTFDKASHIVPYKPTVLFLSSLPI